MYLITYGHDISPWLMAIAVALIVSLGFVEKLPEIGVGKFKSPA